MRLLLDSQVVIWSLSQPERIAEPALRAIISPENEVFVSAATLWEMELKVSKGKLALPADFIESLAAQAFTELPVTWHHTAGISRLPAIHSDPFDRMLLSQALAEGLFFVTADRLCLKYPQALIPA